VTPPGQSAQGGQFGLSCHCEFTPAVGRPALDETSLTVMAGLVPAICSSKLPRPMAGTGPGHDGESDAKSEPDFEERTGV